jgi:hypothetical protein
MDDHHSSNITKLKNKNKNENAYYGYHIELSEQITSEVMSWSSVFGRVGIVTWLTTSLMEWNCHLVDFCVLKSLSKCLVHTTYLVEI